MVCGPNAFFSVRVISAEDGPCIHVCITYHDPATSVGGPCGRDITESMVLSKLHSFVSISLLQVTTFNLVSRLSILGISLWAKHFNNKDVLSGHRSPPGQECYYVTLVGLLTQITQYVDAKCVQAVAEIVFSRKCYMKDNVDSSGRDCVLFCE